MEMLVRVFNKIIAHINDLPGVINCSVKMFPDNNNNGYF